MGTQGSVGRHAFEDARKYNPDPLNRPAYDGASMLMIGETSDRDCSCQRAPRALIR
jgi:hypothetical protein